MVMGDQDPRGTTTHSHGELRPTITSQLATPGHISGFLQPTALRNCHLQPLGGWGGATTHISWPQPRGGIQGQREVLGGQSPGAKEGEVEELAGPHN